MLLSMKDNQDKHKNQIGLFWGNKLKKEDHLFLLTNNFLLLPSYCRSCSLLPPSTCSLSFYFICFFGLIVSFERIFTFTFTFKGVLNFAHNSQHKQNQHQVSTPAIWLKLWFELKVLIVWQIFILKQKEYI